MPGRFEYHSIPRIASVITIAFAGPFFLVSAIGIRINVSPSLPLGLYRKTSDLNARLIEFCPEEPSARLALQRGYRPLGNCPDGGAPLMKPIVATAGDLVNFSEAGIAVNGRLVQNTAPQQKDSRGRHMYPWPSGEYQVPTGFVWVASSYSPWSFDSRYFGPIEVKRIRCRLIPTLTQ
jgi:conjugative transfer signal peptidase TraF